MEIKILYDSNAINDEFTTGWGFSCLVDGTVLFDTGESGESLLKNMALMNVALDRIEAVVISHEHWDHTGGLWDILARRKGVKVYGCPNFSQEFRAKVTAGRGVLEALTGRTEVAHNIFSTGEIAGKYKDKDMPEQSLVLRTKNGLTIITGCAHPGIIAIIKKVKAEFPDEDIYCVLGGFHLKDTNFKESEHIIQTFRAEGIHNVAPAHCTGDDAIKTFKRIFQKDFMCVAAGEIITV